MGRRGDKNKNVTVFQSHRVPVSVLPGVVSSALSAVNLFYQKSLELSSRIVTSPKLTNSTSIKA